MHYPLITDYSLSLPLLLGASRSSSAVTSKGEMPHLVIAPSWSLIFWISGYWLGFSKSTKKSIWGSIRGKSSLPTSSSWLAILPFFVDLVLQLIGRFNTDLSLQPSFFSFTSYSLSCAYCVQPLCQMQPSSCMGAILSPCYQWKSLRWK